MRRFAFSRLLFVVVFVPLVALAIFGGRLSYDSWARYSELSRASSVLRLSVAAVRFGGIAIPGEGGATREFVAGEGGRPQMEAQRRITDDLYRAVREAADSMVVRDRKIDEQLKPLAEQMQAIIAFRTQVDAGSVKSPGASALVIAPAAAFATDLAGTASAVVSDPALSSRIFSLYATLEFAENGTLQRGRGAAALKDGRLPADAFVILVRATTLHATFRKLFVDYAPAQAVERFKAFDAANGRELAELRKLALANSGQPASPEQQRRWAEISGALVGVMGEIISSTADAVSAEGEQMLSAARRDMLIYLALSLTVLSAVIVLSRLVLRTVRELLGELAGVIDQMREGHYDVVIPHIGRADEIGMMARATEGFRENFVRVAACENERKNAEAAAERMTLMSRLAGEFEAAIGNIVTAVSSASGDLTVAATTLTETAENTQRLTTTVSAASDEASSNVQSVASAAEEMAASVSEIGRQVHESSRISGEAVGQAQTTDERITKLSQAASRIGDVTRLITSIAEQTNLLALNATIEAARAGEAGRGFAVVAQEVKGLASQTAKATGEISGQIAEMQAATQESVVAIKEIGATIARISEIATTIASAVEEQGAATQEITRNVQQAATGTMKVALSISDVNDGAVKTGTASVEVLSAAHSLGDQSGRLKAEVEQFLSRVRAA